MRPKIEAEDETWEVRLGREARDGTRPLVFTCVTNGQEPYRVIELPDRELPPDGDVTRIPEARLRELFTDARIMGGEPGRAAAALLAQRGRG